MPGIEMIFPHGASTARGYQLSCGKHSLFFQRGYGGIGAHQTQPQRGCYLRSGSHDLLLHETGDSSLGIHNFIKLLKKV